MSPMFVPIVHANVLGALAVKLTLGPAPLQPLATAALVIAGIGFTETVIVNGAPRHKPVVDVAVTIYSTVPITELLGLVRT